MAYIYIYIYIHIGDWGRNNAVDPNREIGFGFVSCSCRACERAGEAKLCGRVRGECLSTLGVSILTFPAPAVVVAFAFLLLCAWVLRLFGTVSCYVHGFFDLFAFLLLYAWVF